MSVTAVPAGRVRARGLSRVRVWLWRTLTSVKVGVTLLALLTVAAIAGTVIESAVNTATAQRVVYHSLWFIGLMILTAINLTASTWGTMRTVLKLPRTRPILPAPQLFSDLSEVREISGPVSAQALDTAIERHVGGVTVNGPGRFAQRGIVQRWGAIVTHVGILLMLGGSVYLSLRAHIVGPPGGRMLWIGEGISRDWYLAPHPDLEGRSVRERMPFQVRLHDFDADHFPNTEIPKAFTSTIELFAPDGTRSFHRVNMREALRWRGWKFSQASFAVLDTDLNRDMARFLLSLDPQEFRALFERGRMAIQLVDTRTQHPFPVFDAAPGLRVPVPQSDLTFETADGESFRVLRGETVVSEGSIGTGESDPGGLDRVGPGLDSDIQWSVQVDAFFPNYMRGPGGGDGTNGPSLGNPAVRWTLFADGSPIGSDLSFHAPQFRNMRFGDLPVQAIFETYEPGGLTEWHKGEEITVNLNLSVARTGEPIGDFAFGVGDERALPLPSQAADDNPATQPSTDTPAPAVGVHTASAVGRMPAAYSGLSVMRESMGLKVFFYISFLLFLGGPLLAFTAAHCQVWAWVAPDGGRALVGGRARGRKARLTQILSAVEAEVKKENGP